MIAISIDDFERDGFIIVRSLIPPEECRRLTAAVDDVRSGDQTDVVVQHQYGRDNTLKMTKLNQLSTSVPEFIELAHRPQVVDIVESLIGPGARVFRDVVVIKPGPTDGVLRHHQDSAYWDVEPKHLVSAWIALSEAPVEAGPLSVVPGSHQALVRHDLLIGRRLALPSWATSALRRLVSKAGTGDNAATTSGGGLLRRLKRAVLANQSRLAPLLAGFQDYHVRRVDEAQCEVIGALPGDVVFFHSLLIHGTGPNRTSADRVASIISYMPATATLPNVDATTLPLARDSES